MQARAAYRTPSFAIRFHFIQFWLTSQPHIYSWCSAGGSEQVASLFRKRSTAADAATPDIPGERRQLTVLFYDIVESTKLVDGDDPELLRAMLQKIHLAAAQIIEKHGGSLEQVMGDGGMAYFGFPEPSEDAAIQGVRAASALIAARAEIAGAPSIRIGVATSIVVLPDSPEALRSGRLGAVGTAPNLAARLENAAEANTALVGQTTHSLTRRAFEYEPIDGLVLKGFPDVKRAWRIIAERDAPTRLQMIRSTSTPFVARTRESQRIADAWARAADGRGGAILVRGEAGIGKSRIASESAAAAKDRRTVLLQCQPNTQGDALFAFISMFDRAYEEQSRDPELAAAAVRAADEVGALEEDDSLSAENRREAIVACVATIIEDLSQNRPLLLLAEDLHWADEVTLAVMDHLARRAGDHAVLVIGTARADPILASVSEAFEILDLPPLSPASAHALIGAVASVPLTRSMRDWIVEKGDGNPLFLVELTSYVCDTLSTTGRFDDSTGAQVDSLRDLLTFRLESAGPAKRSAQVASILGREYAFRLLTLLAAPRISLDQLEADLDQLCDLGIEETFDGGETYAFHHALIRDVAYDSQLHSVRRALHARVVDLVDHNPGLAGSVAKVLLAEHCLNGGLVPRGLTLLTEVSEDAIRRSARHAPRAMLERVLAQAADLAEGPERNRIEIQAIVLLGPLVTLLDGPRAAAPLYERGQALYFTMPVADRAPWFPILWGWWFTASDLIEQSRRSEVLIRDVPPETDPESRLQALHCAWATLFDAGEHIRSLSAVEDGLALYDKEIARKSRYQYGHDARVCGLGERALSLWMQGRLNDSKSAILASENWADETGHLSSQLHALDIATQTAFFRMDIREIERILTKVASLSEADALPATRAKLDIFRGWIKARTGDAAQASIVTAGLERLKEFGVLEDTPIYADIAADVAWASGMSEQALGPLQEEIDHARRTRLIFWLPELLRRRAILASDAGLSGAAANLDEGFALAIEQDAHHLALRNLATRVELGLSLPTEARMKMTERIGLISDCALKTSVADALRR